MSKTRVECQCCGYVEDVRHRVGLKLWLVSAFIGAVLLGKAYFFDDWNVFLQVCLCMVLGVVALLVSANEIASVSRTKRHCPRCGKCYWKIRI